MELTGKNVQEIILYCLYNKDEDDNNRIEAKGVEAFMRLHPGRIKERTDDIITLLNQTPEEFRNTGDSFLKLCVDRKGIPWGEHRDCDYLLVLGDAIGKIQYLLPRVMWRNLPGGVPYIKINV